jgi:hypothetical protein
MAPCILLSTTNVVIAFYFPAVLKHLRIFKTSSMDSNTKSETNNNKSGTEKSLELRTHSRTTVTSE